MTTEFAFNATVAGSTVTVEAGRETFTLPRPTPSPITGSMETMTEEEAEALAALLNTITVETFAAQPFTNPVAAAIAFMLGVQTHLRFAAKVRHMAEEAEAAGAAVNHEALAPLTGGTR